MIKIHLAQVIASTGDNRIFPSPLTVTFNLPMSGSFADALMNITRIVLSTSRQLVLGQDAPYQSLDSPSYDFVKRVGFLGALPSQFEFASTSARFSYLCLHLAPRSLFVMNTSIPAFISSHLMPSITGPGGSPITLGKAVCSFGWVDNFVIAASVAWILFHRNRVRNKIGLKDIPGPWFASCSILYRFYYAVTKRNWHTKLTSLHRKYGPIVRIAPNEVSINDPSAVRVIYAYGYKGYPKSEMYDTGISNGFFNIAIERDVTRHAIGRRVIAKNYTMASAIADEIRVDNVVHEFITAIDRKFASTGDICDFSIWAEYFTYDMITNILFGKSFGCCRSASDIGGGLRAARQLLHLTTVVSYMPWIWGLIRIKCIKAIGEFFYRTSVRREIEKRFNNGNPSGQRDLLQDLFDARYRDGSPLPLEEITNHAYMLTLAAPDATGVALCTIILNLVRYPHVHAALLAQLLDAKLSETPTWKELSDVPLLAAIVKESMRLHPPAGFTLPRTVPAGGHTFCGKYLPEGTIVGMSAWCVHANEDFWGTDTLEFKPERWLDTHSARKLKSYGMTFGQGARLCLGKPIALLQLMKVTAELVLSFEFEIEENCKIRNLFMFLVVVDGLRVRFVRRK